MDTAVRPNRKWMIAVVLGLVALTAIGCVPRDTLEKMQDQLNYLESSDRRHRREMERIDSLLTENLTSNRELRADVYTALDQLKQELAANAENLADLGDKIDRRGTQHAVTYPQTMLDTGGTSSDIPVTKEPSQTITIDCGKLYDQGFDDLRNGNYDLAIEGFNEFLKTCASSPDVPRAMYWLGESYYSNDDFAGAIDILKALMADYPEHDKIPMALYKLARCYEKSDQPRHAITYYEQLIKEYPDNPVTRPAENQLESLKKQESE